MLQPLTVVLQLIKTKIKLTAKTNHQPHKSNQKARKGFFFCSLSSNEIFPAILLNRDQDCSSGCWSLSAGDEPPFVRDDIISSIIVQRDQRIQTNKQLESY